jgi:probable rRNA maturation factor
MRCVAHVQGSRQDRGFFPFVRQAAESTMRQAAAGPCEVNVALVDEERMRQLNGRYAGIDQATDVLSFESGADDPASGRTILGDVAVCLPIALAQAERAGHDLQAELALLTVHGVLHLLGYDHAEPEDRRRMWERQDAVLRDLGHVIEDPSGAG